MLNKVNLKDKYPPSPPCDCSICKSFCKRPGWWTVDEAGLAVDAGYGNKMMLEISPELTFGVLSPAFSGCEVSFSQKQFAEAGCCFLTEGLCELHGSGFQPLECRFCHHNNKGKGNQCHLDIEKEWKSYAGRLTIEKWIKQTGFKEASYYRKSLNFEE